MFSMHVCPTLWIKIGLSLACGRNRSKIGPGARAIRHGAAATARQLHGSVGLSLRQAIAVDGVHGGRDDSQGWKQRACPCDHLIGLPVCPEVPHVHQVSYAACQILHACSVQNVRPGATLGILLSVTEHKILGAVRVTKVDYFNV